MKAKLYESTGQRILAEIEIFAPADLIIWPGNSSAANPYGPRFFVFDPTLSDFPHERRDQAIAGYHEAGIVANVGTHLGRLNV